MAGDAAGGGKKRPRMDLLASLDAAFAVKPQKPASKYTSQAAVKESEATSQQAYLHKRKPKQQPANANANGNNRQLQHGGNNSNSKQSDKRNGNGSSNSNSRDQKPQVDPLYVKLPIDILAVGLKNCSLLPQVATLKKSSMQRATLKQYLGSVMAEGVAAEKLKNKVLQLDNPIKKPTAAANGANAVNIDAGKRLSARQRRQLGLHVIKKGESMQVADAEQLCAIWQRYARDFIGADLWVARLCIVEDTADDRARNAKVQFKFKSMDLSGCPIEVIASENPTIIGAEGIVIAEKQQVLQICTRSSGKVITLPKQGSRFRVALDDRRGVNTVTPIPGMRQLCHVESEHETDGKPAGRNGGFQSTAQSTGMDISSLKPSPGGGGPGVSRSSALRSMHNEYFEPPRLSLVQVVVTLIAYFLFVTDILRAGSSVDDVPFKQIEPNVYSNYGPTILPTMTLVRTANANSNPTMYTLTSPTHGDGVSTTAFKYATSSYGMRAILAERTEDMHWPACMSKCDDACDATLPLATVFTMIESLVATIHDNAANAQCGSLNGSMVITLEYLSTLPQRVRFAIRTKARWIDGASNFLSHYIFDQKYWMSTWATVFDDFDIANPGMDICLDDLDRSLFYEKSWTDFMRLVPDGSAGAAVGKIWDDISSEAAALQLAHPTKTLDMTIIETETDPLTLLGGVVVLTHKLYNVVVVYRIRDCVTTVDPLNAKLTTKTCTTLEIHDVRYEGGVLHTDAIEWRYITKTMRYFAQVYNIVRLLALMVACYAAVNATKNAVTPDFAVRIKVAARIFFAIPSQVVVYGSFIPAFVYAAAHVIDGVILYQINDSKMHSVNEFFANRFGDMVELVSVCMRNVWVIAIIARMFVFVQTSGGWTPAKGVPGIKGFLLPFISCVAVSFVLRSSSLQDSRILETNKVEPAATFMYIRAETLDMWKMNAFGLYNDFLALGLTSIAYVTAMVALQLMRRCYYKRDTSKESLFFATSEVPYSAGFLWDPSYVVVCWGNEIYSPVLRLVSPSASSSTLNAMGLARRGSNVVTKEVENRYVLMNIAFLSDPWNFLTMNFGHTRIHLFELLPLKRKLLHPYSKARFLHEYEMKTGNLALLGTFNVSERNWEQVITCM
ncbi:Vacuolar protein sorting-associated protein 16, partial [Globisporangium splendens]